LKSEIANLKNIIKQNKLELNTLIQKLNESEKAKDGISKEKQKLKKELESKQEIKDKLLAEKENMEIQIKKIPELINDEINKFKKKKESQEKKNKTKY